MSNISCLILSKDRPLFLREYLEGLMLSDMKITVYFKVTNVDYRAAYNILRATFQTVTFREQAEPMHEYLDFWTQHASKYVLVTCDDNLVDESIPTGTIEEALSSESVWGFNLRMQGGMYRYSPSEYSDDCGCFFYDPTCEETRGTNWGYVFEISSTIIRREDMLKVIQLGPLESANELEKRGKQVWMGKVTRMGVLSRAPMCNVYVSTWRDGVTFDKPVPDAEALKLYNQGQRIDVDRTFEERDSTGVEHVTELFLL